MTEVAPPTDRKRSRFDLAVAAVALLCGSVLAVVIPPLGGWDEPVHFLRAWQVSDGGVFPRTGTDANGTPDLFGQVPASLPGEMRAIMRDGLFNPHNAQHAYSHLNDAEPHGPPTWQGFEGAGAYSPVPYLPAALAIRAGRTLGLSTLAMIELARLAQVVAYAAIIGLAVRRIKRRRPVLAVLALAPVALIQVGTVSADPLTTALTLLVVAEASHLLSLPSEEIGIAHLAEVAAVLVALALAKPPYLLVGVFLLLPLWRHRGRVALGLGAAAAAAMGFAVTWNLWAQHHYVPQNGLVSKPGTAFYAFHDVVPRDQFGYVRSHPFSFLAAIGRTLAHYPGDLVEGAFTQSPSWQPPRAMVLGAVLLVVFALVASPVPLPGGRPMRLLGLGVAGALFVSLLFLAYVGWNAVAAPRIDAFQGRYLLPVVAVLAVVVTPPLTARSRTDEGALGAILAGSAMLALWVAVGMARFFYF
jgi:uncharacterized membrane protein